VTALRLHSPPAGVELAFAVGSFRDLTGALLQARLECLGAGRAVDGQ